MKIIELSHTIEPEMPVYPGTASPKIVNANTIESHGFREKLLTMVSHTGTHIDAPAHILKDGKPLDQFPISHFAGPGLVIDCSLCINSTMTVEDLSVYEYKIAAAEFILFHSGWDTLWGTDEYYANFPVLDREAALWLCKGFKLKGLGTDAISFDHENSPDFPIHQILLNNNLVLIENLRNLGSIVPARFIFTCFPLKIKDADGSPVRAAAMIV